MGNGISAIKTFPHPFKMNTYVLNEWTNWFTMPDNTYTLTLINCSGRPIYFVSPVTDGIEKIRSVEEIADGNNLHLSKLERFAYGLLISRHIVNGMPTHPDGTLKVLLVRNALDQRELEDRVEKHWTVQANYPVDKIEYREAKYIPIPEMNAVCSYDRDFLEKMLMQFESQEEGCKALIDGRLAEYDGLSCNIINCSKNRYWTIADNRIIPVPGPNGFDFKTHGSGSVFDDPEYAEEALELYNEAVMKEFGISPETINSNDDLFVILMSTHDFPRRKNSLRRMPSGGKTYIKKFYVIKRYLDNAGELFRPIYIEGLNIPLFRSIEAAKTFIKIFKGDIFQYYGCQKVLQIKRQSDVKIDRVKTHYELKEKSAYRAAMSMASSKVIDKTVELGFHGLSKLVDKFLKSISAVKTVSKAAKAGKSLMNFGITKVMVGAGGVSMEISPIIGGKNMSNNIQKEIGMAELEARKDIEKNVNNNEYISGLMAGFNGYSESGKRVSTAERDRTILKIDDKELPFGSKIKNEPNLIYHNMKGNGRYKYLNPKRIDLEIEESVIPKTYEEKKLDELMKAKVKTDLPPLTEEEQEFIKSRKPPMALIHLYEERLLAACPAARTLDPGMVTEVSIRIWMYSVALRQKRRDSSLRLPESYEDEQIEEFIRDFYTDKEKAKYAEPLYKYVDEMIGLFKIDPTYVKRRYGWLFDKNPAYRFVSQNVKDKLCMCQWLNDIMVYGEDALHFQPTINDSLKFEYEPKKYCSNPKDIEEVYEQYAKDGKRPFILLNDVGPGEIDYDTIAFETHNFLRYGVFDFDKDGRSILLWKLPRSKNMDKDGRFKTPPDFVKGVMPIDICRYYYRIKPWKLNKDDLEKMNDLGIKPLIKYEWEKREYSDMHDFNRRGYNKMGDMEEKELALRINDLISKGYPQENITLDQIREHEVPLERKFELDENYQLTRSDVMYLIWRKIQVMRENGNKQIYDKKTGIPLTVDKYGYKINMVNFLFEGTHKEERLKMKKSTLDKKTGKEYEESYPVFDPQAYMDESMDNHKMEKALGKLSEKIQEVPHWMEGRLNDGYLKVSNEKAEGYYVDFDKIIPYADECNNFTQWISELAHDVVKELETEYKVYKESLLLEAAKEFYEKRDKMEEVLTKESAYFGELFKDKKLSIYGQRLIDRNIEEVNERFYMTGDFRDRDNFESYVFGDTDFLQTKEEKANNTPSYVSTVIERVNDIDGNNEETFRWSSTERIPEEEMYAEERLAKQRSGDNSFFGKVKKFFTSKTAKTIGKVAAAVGATAGLLFGGFSALRLLKTAGLVFKFAKNFF